MAPILQKAHNSIFSLLHKTGLARKHDLAQADAILNISKRVRLNFLCAPQHTKQHTETFILHLNTSSSKRRQQNQQMIGVKTSKFQI